MNLDYWIIMALPPIIFIGLGVYWGIRKSHWDDSKE